MSLLQPIKLPDRQYIFKTRGLFQPIKLHDRQYIIKTRGLFQPIKLHDRQYIIKTREYLNECARRVSEITIIMYAQNKNNRKPNISRSLKQTDERASTA